MFLSWEDGNFIFTQRRAQSAYKKNLYEKQPPLILHATAYAQWVVIVLRNVGNSAMKVKNVSLNWGKFHADGDKDKEIGKNQIEGKVIGPDEKLQIDSCGRLDASSRTEGPFDLIDVNVDDRTI
ncbi:pleurotolysin a [Moniliophthora roreri MCA 2997]|uniref:Pleurotolysin a n=1 Tax=Moniliophthora roreri (strain MCA 2997) TaxID=1381753 RepID=V2WFC5_MONRO|nr:pleurotolysin a [Moniliophthora roreri MCA 2997]